MEFGEVVEVERTADVRGTASFESLMISPAIVTNLYKKGFRRPSPVQEKAIPVALAGLDVLVQAKSGTGKTLVFSIMALEGLDVSNNRPQRMILAPTREICHQIRDTIIKLSPQRIKVGVFIGGTPLKTDVETLKAGCHVVVGSLGRTRQMAALGHLNLEHVDLFVLDEADRLMDDCFREDINYLFSSLPPARQVAVFSATYPDGLDNVLSNYMKRPTLVRLNADDVQLVGVKQYVTIVYEDGAKTLVSMLNRIQYDLVMVFANHHDDCEKLAKYLNANDFNASLISSKMTQAEREKAIEDFRRQTTKILISTDLTARGIDVDKVNLVINMQAPFDSSTYFHRIGRAARFGGFGASITILTDSRAVAVFSKLVRENAIRARLLSLGNTPFDITTNTTFYESCAAFVADRNIGVEEKSPSPPLEEKAANGAEKSKTDELADLFDAALSVSEPVAETKEVELTVNGKENGNESDTTEQTKNFASDLANLKDSMATDAQATALAPKKYKFVPMRKKTKKLFYMRGELLAIRDSVGADVWKRLAESKYDLTSEPFCMSPRVETAPAVVKTEENSSRMRTAKPTVSTKTDSNGVASTSKDGGASLKNKPNSDSKKKQKGGDAKRNGAPQQQQQKARKWVPPKDDGVLRYTRFQMIGVQINTSKKAWLEYAKSKWDTSSEPFELDQWLRCSFEEQLRRRRAREKQQRQQVLEERKKALESRLKVPSSSRFVASVPFQHASLQDFRAHTLRLFEEHMKAPIVVGPVISVREPAEEWQPRVRQLADYVAHLTDSFHKSASGPVPEDEPKEAAASDVPTPSTVSLAAESAKPSVKGCSASTKSSLSTATESETVSTTVSAVGRVPKVASPVLEDVVQRVSELELERKPAVVRHSVDHPTKVVPVEQVVNLPFTSSSSSTSPVVTSFANPLFSSPVSDEFCSVTNLYISLMLRS